jgi:hypothetical protein
VSRDTLPRIAGGEHVLWAFSEARIGSRRYLFLLVNPHLGGETDATLELDHQLRAFDRQLRAEAAIAHTYPEQAFNAYREVLAKPWPTEAQDVQRRMEDTQHPFLLAIDTDFAAFDPRKDSWAILWLPDVRGSEDAHEADNRLALIFTRIAQAVARGRDVFDYLGEVQRGQDGQQPRWSRLFRSASTTHVGVALQAAALAEKTALDVLG